MKILTAASFIATKPGGSLLAPRCECGHPESYHDGNGCHAPAGIALEYDCACSGFHELTWWDALIRRAGIEPIGTDISDFSDDFCTGFLAGQKSILEEIAAGRLSLPPQPSNADCECHHDGECDPGCDGRAACGLDVAGRPCEREPGHQGPCLHSLIRYEGSA